MTSTAFQPFKLPGLLLCMMAALLLWNCKKSDDSVPLPSGFEYYPIDSGHYVVYRVTEINYRPTFVHDTLHYLQRERIGGVFNDARGLESRLIYIEKSDTSGTAPWVIDSVWHVHKSTTQVVRTEDNFPVVRLIFPVKEGDSWNANILNILPEENYKYYNVNRSVEIKETTPYGISEFIIGNKATAGAPGYYPQSLVVIQNDLPDDFVVGSDWRREVYAVNIGMVYKETLTLRRNTAADDASNMGKVIGGQFLKMVYQSHGPVL